MIGSKADYRRDDFIMARQTKTPWIPLQESEPIKPLWPYFVLIGLTLFCIVLLIYA